MGIHVAPDNPISRVTRSTSVLEASMCMHVPREVLSAIDQSLRHSARETLPLWCSMTVLHAASDAVFFVSVSTFFLSSWLN